MKIAESKLLLEFARLMLRIGQAQNPLCALDVTEKTVTRSAGFKKLRAFYVSLTPRKRAQFAGHVRKQIDGVKAMERLALANGERFNLGDITIELYDAETRKPIRAEDAPHLEPAEPEPTQEQ